MIQNDVVVGHRYESVAKVWQPTAGDGYGVNLYAQRPTYLEPITWRRGPVVNRMVRSPLDMQAAANIAGDAYRQLRPRFLGFGPSRRAARQGVMNLIQASHIANRTL